LSTVIITVVLSITFCGIYLVLARHFNFLDRPNERSAHVTPTPSGGGVPLLLALLAGYSLSGPWPVDYHWLLALTLALMLLGVMDDLRGLSVSIRFSLYSIVSLGTAALVLPGSLALPGLFEVLVAAFAILWALNLYNFMDGIDGIAALQCVLACSAAAALCTVDSVASADYARFCVLIGAAQLGFLVWNWAPARLFMGDAGSIPTGFLLAALALYGAVNGFLSFATWAVLLAVFITDASWTLARRLLGGQNFTQAHAEHAYQKLSRRWASHRTVVLLLGAVNLLWLFPIAWAMQQWPGNSFYFVTLAYIPLLLAMAKLGKLT
jgi:glycosyltransferase WbpL